MCERRPSKRCLLIQLSLSPMEDWQWRDTTATAAGLALTHPTSAKEAFSRIISRLIRAMTRWCLSEMEEVTFVQPFLYANRTQSCAEKATHWLNSWPKCLPRPLLDRMLSVEWPAKPVYTLLTLLNRWAMSSRLSVCEVYNYTCSSCCHLLAQCVLLY